MCLFGLYWGCVITSSGCCYVSSVSKAYVLLCQGVIYASKYHCNCFLHSEACVLERVALYLLVGNRVTSVVVFVV